MNLFKKKEKKECCCSQIDEESVKKAEELIKDDGIKILGSGCQKCDKLEESVRIALSEFNFNLPIEHITDFSQIASYGVCLLYTSSCILQTTSMHIEKSFVKHFAD